ncbi:hypothetical protein MMC11_002806 [Xylographa trunciseda]|nr:hypothetical protein [Xylographa trunciseda]
MGTANASIRKHIRRLPGEATEPTSTLVLTSHESWFVDVRILAATREDGTREALPTDGSPMSRLEWAFAGKSYTTQSKVAGGPAHTVWHHEIDSQTADPEKDEGDMYEQEDGDILECGQNVDAETGEVKKYEELWHDIGVHLVGQEKDHLSAVLMADNQDNNTKGMIVRVGNWCQGILKVGDDTTVERWQWSHGDDWQLVAKLGQELLVCGATFDRGSLELGKVISHHHLDWQVAELYSWK